ncbi:MAG: hypothetical protein PHD82_06665, partial [Candidatus Riflebacteria bacterium]|nr:hypothetical protein [Candidatus Riflebacteria bacterium]
MSVFTLWNDMRLKWKLLFLGLAGVFLMAASSIILSNYTNGTISSEVEKAMLVEAENQGKLIAEGVLNMVKTQDQLLRIKLAG